MTAQRPYRPRRQYLTPTAWKLTEFENELSKARSGNGERAGNGRRSRHRHEQRRRRLNNFYLSIRNYSDIYYNLINHYSAILQEFRIEIHEFLDEIHCSSHLSNIFVFSAIELQCSNSKL